MCIAITVFYVCRCWLCRIGSWPTNWPLVFMPTGRVSDSQRLLVVGFVCFLSMSMRRYCHISVQKALYDLPCKDKRGSSSIKWTLEAFQRWCWGKFWETGWTHMGFSECIVTELYSCSGLPDWFSPFSGLVFPPPPPCCVKVYRLQSPPSTHPPCTSHIRISHSWSSSVKSKTRCLACQMLSAEDGGFGK